MKKHFYRVADHLFSLALPEADSLADELTQYAPFATEAGEAEEQAFSLRVVAEGEFPDTGDLAVELTQDDDGSQIVAGQAGQRPYFEFLLRGRRAARLLTDGGYRNGIIALDGNRIFGLNNAVMIMFALATAGQTTALFHSSVVSHGGRAYMFLGKSGTGKSTHSSLWLRHISGTSLVNDDNPVVRLTADGFRVFGSPWSGKTPCYRNVSFPLGGIVNLSQAPYNKIRKLKPIEAYAALVPSISGKRWDPHVAEGLHQTENLLAGRVPTWHLECLPDEAAARLCCQTVAAGE